MISLNIDPSVWYSDTSGQSRALDYFFFVGGGGGDGVNMYICLFKIAEMLIKRPISDLYNERHLHDMCFHLIKTLKRFEYFFSKHQNDAL